MSVVVTCNQAFLLSPIFSDFISIFKSSTSQEYKDSSRVQCSTCGRTLWNKKYLADHMRLHTGERPFECQTCGASFTSRSSLQKHTKLHKKHLNDDYQYVEKPFHCQICGKKFAELHTKQVHEKST